MFDFITHYTVTFLSSAVTMALGALLFMLKIPHVNEWKNFRAVRLCLAMTCIVLSVCNFASCMLQIEDEDPRVLSSITLFVASYQAMLFTTAALVFMMADRVSRKSIITQLVIISAFTVILLCTLSFLPQLFWFVFWESVIAYAFQIFYYTRTFGKEYKRCLRRLEEYYDEDEAGRLRWIKQCFYSALAVGVLAFLFAVVPFSLVIYDWFIFAYTCYYVYIAACVMNYRIEASFIMKAVAVADDAYADDAEIDIDGEGELDSEPGNRERQFSRWLGKWVSEKKYTEKDISPDDLARMFGTSRRYVINYFAVYEQTSFREWRTRLRIKEAERILREESNVTISALNEMVGIGDRSNFYKYFRQATNMTPSEYRHKYHDDDM